MLKQDSASSETVIGKFRAILSVLLIFLLFFVFVFMLLFGSFSSFGGHPLIPEGYFIYFVIGMVLAFSVLAFLLIHYMQSEISNSDPILNTEDYNASSSLRVMTIGATIASLTFTIYAITGKSLGLGFLRILIVPSVFSSIFSTLAFIVRRFRSELLLTSLLLLLAVFLMFIFILPQFF